MRFPNMVEKAARSPAAPANRRPGAVGSDCPA
jgi:hypothetical protein